KRGAKKAAPKKAAPKKAAAKSADPDAPKPAKKAAAKKAAVKPKSEAVSKARAPVASAAKTSAAKPATAPKTPAKKSAGKARGEVKRKHENGFPSRDAIVAFIRASTGKTGTREIAREFGLKNADRVELKRILRELADEGVIAKQGKALHEPAALPPTVMADITGRDKDGELIAVPTEWDEEQSGAAPKIRIHVPRRPQPGTAAGVGDRALLRVEKPDD